MPSLLIYIGVSAGGAVGGALAVFFSLAALIGYLSNTPFIWLPHEVGKADELIHRILSLKINSEGFSEEYEEARDRLSGLCQEMKDAIGHDRYVRSLKDDFEKWHDLICRYEELALRLPSEDKIRKALKKQWKVPDYRVGMRRITLPETSLFVEIQEAITEIEAAKRSLQSAEPARIHMEQNLAEGKKRIEAEDRDGMEAEDEAFAEEGAAADRKRGKKERHA